MVSLNYNDRITVIHHIMWKKETRSLDRNNCPILFFFRRKTWRNRLIFIIIILIIERLMCRNVSRLKLKCAGYSVLSSKVKFVSNSFCKRSLARVSALILFSGRSFHFISVHLNIIVDDFVDRVLELCQRNCTLYLSIFYVSLLLYI